jgi:hypothetical protein
MEPSRTDSLDSAVLTELISQGLAEEQQNIRPNIWYIFRTQNFIPPLIKTTLKEYLL